MESRRQRRVSKSAAIYIPAGALLIAFLTVLGISSFLRIMVIEVQGTTRYAATDVISVSGIGRGDNMLFMDLEAAERRIAMAMPFIRDVEITRMPPDRILIEVTESTPVAAIDVRGEFLIIDSNGRILEQVESFPAGLIEVRGFTPIEIVVGSPLRTAPGQEMTQLQYLRDVLAAFEREEMADDVSFLDVTFISQVSFGYMGRFRVLLGRPDHLGQKLSRLPGAIDRINERIGEDVAGDIDLSNPVGDIPFTRSA